MERVRGEEGEGEMWTGTTESKGLWKGPQEQAKYLSCQSRRSHRLPSNMVWIANYIGYPPQPDCKTLLLMAIHISLNIKYLI